MKGSVAMMLKGSASNHKSSEDSPRSGKVDGKKLAPTTTSTTTTTSGEWRKSGKKGAESDIRNKKGFPFISSFFLSNLTVKGAAVIVAFKHAVARL